MTPTSYAVQFAKTPEQVLAAQRLRHLCFAGDEVGLDQDDFDQACHHVLIFDQTTDQLVCTFRFMYLPSTDRIQETYSAQFYELSNLNDIKGPVLEMGRFCIHPSVNDPTILRLAWSVVTKFVDEEGVEFLFGCSSFHGTDIDTYEHAFALLKERHLAPKRRLPRIKAPRVFEFARKLRLKKPDLRLANKGLPPLLRTYLTMGGWVSDHAVVDDQLNTLHVFTGVEINLIPETRKRLLRAAVV